MKRIIATFLTFCLLLSSVGVVAMQDVAGHTYEEEIKVVEGLGLMDQIAEGEFSPDAIVTRADIADLLSRFIAYGQGDSENDSWFFFGDASEDEGLKTPPEPKKYMFEDVDASHWAYQQIEKAVTFGLMRGTETNLFSPDENATLDQVVKTIVSLLGYGPKAEQLYGGYPDGYYRVATELGLLKGFTITREQTVTRAQFAVIVYRALFTEVSMIDGYVTGNADAYLNYYTQKGKTLLTEQLGLYEIEGQMTDNGITSLQGKSKVKDKKLVINGKTLYYTDDTYYARDFIGRDVTAYYFKDGSDNEYQLVYAYLTGDDEVTVIDANEDPKLSGNTLKYESKLTDDTEEIDLTDFKYVILNGEAVTSYLPSIVEITQGTVTVVQSEDNYDVLIIESYESWYVNNVNATNGKIYDKITGGIFDPLLYDNITVVTTNGEKTDLTKIGKGSVIDIARNGKSAYIIISSNAKTGIIQQVLDSGEEFEVYIDDEPYVIAEPYYNYDKRSKFKIGTEITLYLNSENKVIYAVDGAVSDLSVGYLITAANNTNRLDSYPEALISETSLNATIYRFADRVRISDETGEESTVEVQNFISEFGSYKGIVRYKKNDEGRITYIEKPILDPETKIGGKLHVIYSSADGYDPATGALVDDSKTYFKNTIFAGKAIVTTSAKVIAVDPAKKTTKEGFIHGDSSSLISNEEDYNMTVYTTVAGSYSAEFAVLETDSASAGAIDYYQNKKFAVLQKITTGVDDEGEAATKLYVYDMSLATPQEVVYYATDDCVINTAMANPFGGTLEVGDIISWGTNDEGKINEIRVIWDENAENPASPIAQGGTKGSFTGCYGYYDALRASEINNVAKPAWIPNPWGTVTNDPKVESSNSESFSGGQARFIYGFPLDTYGGAVRITTYDVVKNGFNPATLDTDLFKTEVWLPGTKVTAVNFKNNKVTCVSGSVLNDQLRTYADYNKDSSRVILISAFSTCWRMIIINGYSE